MGNLYGEIQSKTSNKMADQIEEAKYEEDECTPIRPKEEDAIDDDAQFDDLDQDMIDEDATTNMISTYDVITKTKS